MATILFKDGIPSRFDAKRVNGALSAGWSVTNEPDIVPAIVIPTFVEADTNKTGKLSNDEVREAAKDAGLVDWDIARIKNLKRKLGYDI